MLPILLLTIVANAQQYRFPADESEVEHWYPTAYRDHGGVDWACGDIRYSGHRGSDFGGGGFSGMDEGRDVVAAAPGIVVAAVDGNFDRCTTADCPGGGGFGNYVKLRHPDGLNTYYAHLRNGSVDVAEGDWVACGDHLGQMGSSGHSTGPHLHFEVRDEQGDSYEPFQGSCSDTSFSMWVDQGTHGDLPSLQCDDSFPTCEPIERLTCGASVAARNDDPGSQTRHEVYGCTTASYTGPELTYTFATDTTEPVRLQLTELTDDLDVMVLESSECLGRGCITRAHADGADAEDISFEATAGVEYTLVVDGWQGAVSPFRLQLDCTGSDPFAEPDDPDDDTGIPEQGGRIPGEASGCSCESAPATPVSGLPLLVAVLLWRRRCTIAR